MSFDPRDLRIADYHYDLPEEKIAKFPLAQRELSKLLVYEKSQIKDLVFRDLPIILNSSDLLVFNESKVIRARLLMQRLSGANVEVFCLHPSNGKPVEKALAEGPGTRWVCLVRGLKKWKSGELVLTHKDDEGNVLDLKAERNPEAVGETTEVVFRWEPADLTFSEVVERLGKIPLPPYLKREEELPDSQRYQTVFARIPGSVAAPTAGLHFTSEVLDMLAHAGIEMPKVTLHVGAGTFLPVKSESIGGHEMHSEVAEVRVETIKALSGAQGRIVAVGTTSLRTIESLYWLAEEWRRTGQCPAIVHQWQRGQTESSFKENMAWLMGKMEATSVSFVRFSTQIIITPGYKVRSADGLVTNFHQPGSTLLLLIASFIGEDWKKVYDHALESEYRFLSYGDSSLLWRS
jgi:S-adenosylmethionine:tRNA ribosyltransferase-isomerase